MHDGHVYLDFGAHRRTDSAATLKPEMTDRCGVDGAGLQGRAMCVQGVLEEPHGPLILTTHIKRTEKLR